ncbi:MAG: hypothetical protein GY835_26265 [bacterium]|nr:hypothetical protein [bacterium]
MLRNTLSGSLILISLLLLSGCQTPLSDTNEKVDHRTLSNRGFSTHIVTKGDYLRDLDQEVLKNYDTIILGQQNLPYLEEQYLDHAVLYFNMWGKCRYMDIGDWPKWQLAPGNVGQEDLVMNGGVHCYRFDDAHVEMFLGWIEAFLSDYRGRVKGVYLDDFSWGRSWWSGEDSVRDAIWGPMDGRPGWGESSIWNEERVRVIEAGALALVREYIGPQGEVIVNGSFRTLPEVRRFAENAGQYNSEAWDRLEVEGVDPYRYMMPGDMLHVNGVGASGVWGDWSQTNAGYGWNNLVRAGNLAIERSLSVGLAYGETPDCGGTLYQLYFDPAEPGQEWPGYLIDEGD